MWGRVSDPSAERNSAALTSTHHAQIRRSLRTHRRHHQEAGENRDCRRLPQVEPAGGSLGRSSFSVRADRSRHGRRRRCKWEEGYCGKWSRSFPRKTEEELTAAYRKHGDLGAAAAEVLLEAGVRTGALAGPGRAKLGSEENHEDSISNDGLIAREVQAAFRKIAAARGSAAKAILLRELLSQVTPLEAKYIVKIITGDLRIGLKESLVEEAIAKAFGALGERRTASQHAAR